jgi:hypothetical protein
MLIAIRNAGHGGKFLIVRWVASMTVRREDARAGMNDYQVMFVTAHVLD